MNLVEKAQKVMLFKANIAKECKKRGMRMPSDEKISEYINSGYTLTLEYFMMDYVAKEGVFREAKKEPSPLETATLDATMKSLDETQLCVLYNVYNSETDRGSENFVYDLANVREAEHLAMKLDQDTVLEIGRMVTHGNTRFITIVGGEPQSIDIKEKVEQEWPNIFDRVMLWPDCYEYEYNEGVSYFTNIFAPIMIKMLGYTIDQSLNEVTYKGEK